MALPLFSATSKLLKAPNESASDIESEVSKALLDLEANTDLSSALRGLYFVGAEEIVIRDDKVQSLMIITH